MEITRSSLSSTGRQCSACFRNERASRSSTKSVLRSRFSRSRLILPSAGQGARHHLEQVLRVRSQEHDPHRRPLEELRAEPSQWDQGQGVQGASLILSHVHNFANDPTGFDGQRFDGRRARLRDSVRPSFLLSHRSAGAHGSQQVPPPTRAPSRLYAARPWTLQEARGADSGGQGGSGGEGWPSEARLGCPQWLLYAALRATISASSRADLYRLCFVFARPTRWPAGNDARCGLGPAPLLRAGSVSLLAMTGTAPRHVTETRGVNSTATETEGEVSLRSGGELEALLLALPPPSPS